MSAPSEEQIGKSSGRQHRQEKASQRLSDIVDSGQVTPGVLRYTTPEMASQESAPTAVTASASAEMASHMPAIKRKGPAGTKNAPETTKAPSMVNHNGQFTRLPDTNDPELIYDWGLARPPLDPTTGSFLPLSDRHRKWKSDYDEMSKRFIPAVAPLDEWAHFSGSLGLVPPVFVTRAKRAFWAGKSWKDHERRELQAYSIEMELPKLTRLAIFEQLKVRLCEEIWLQPYPERPLDSKIPTPEADERDTAYAAPRPTKRQRTEEARASPTGWAVDSQGTPLQPLYEDETEPPSMDRHLAAFRQDRIHLVDQIQRGVRNGRLVAEESRLAHANGVTVSGRPAEMPSWELSLEMNERDMETSDEEEMGEP